ncbi:MAG: IS21-like element helper ATPase IstB [Actinobacteria bacterium]|nr:IS21-like element helper ATPase IstB [Actinomycetota bacterium]
MLREQTLEKLRHMQLRGMVAALATQSQDADAQALSFEERLGLLVDEEWTQRRNRALARLLREAKLRLPACPEDLDYSPARGLDRALMRSLTTSAFVREHQNVLLVGATGVGKTYVACALGNACCRQGLRARYFRLPGLLTALALAKGDGSYPAFMGRLAKTDLLILDDFGLAPLSGLEARDLLEVIDERVLARSTLVASQLPLEHWHGAILDPTLADAILDRLIHNAHKIQLKGESMRKLKASTRTSTAPGTEG